MRLIILLVLVILSLIGVGSSYIPNIRNLVTQNCLKYDAKKICIQCYFRFVLIKDVCVKVSDQCKTWNATTAACITCYDGWVLKDGKCVLPGPGPQCYFRQVMIDGKCVKVSDQCKQWSSTTALCTLCYQGYKLTNGVCHV